MNDRLAYGKGAEVPLYRGEFEIVHPNCAFVGMAKCLNHNLDIGILNREPQEPFYWARFVVERSLSESEIQQILEPWFSTNVLKRVRVWCNEATVFEVLVNDLVLRNVQPIIRLPFGEIVSYTASLDSEYIVILSPPHEEESGKCLLFEIEERLKKEANNAELISYRRLRGNEISDAYMTPVGFLRKQLDYEEKKISTDSRNVNSKLNAINRRIFDRFVREWKLKKEMVREESEE